MTKNRIIGAIAALSLLAVPAVAAAHSSGDDHGHHNGRHHHHKHHGKKARDVTGAATGTISSFANGELTITLPSGKSFTADVKRRTVIRCKSLPVVPAATTARHGNDDGNGGSGRGGNDDGPNHDVGDDHGNHGSTTAPATTTTPSTTVPPTTGNHSNDDHNNGHGTRCGTAALVAGTKVLSATLKLSGDGVAWKKVTLLK